MLLFYLYWLCLDSENSYCLCSSLFSPMLWWAFWVVMVCLYRAFLLLYWLNILLYLGIGLCFWVWFLFFLCVFLFCLKNSYYVWFSCWLFWCNCKPTIYNCWPAILKSWRRILKSWCRMRRLLLVGDWLFFQSQIHIPSTSPKQSTIWLAPCFINCSFVL